MLLDAKLQMGDKVTIIKNKQSQLQDLMVHFEIKTNNKINLIYFTLEMKADLHSGNL